MKYHSVILILLLSAVFLLNSCNTMPMENAGSQTEQGTESVETADSAAVQEEKEIVEELPEEEILPEEVLIKETQEEEIIPEEEMLAEEIEVVIPPTDPSEEPVLQLPADSTLDLPKDFIYPKTDGSTSTINLENAVRKTIFGEEQQTAHTKTYTAFDNLVNDRCELIFITPLSARQLQTMENIGFRHEAEPVAGEGFVFVVNKNNPVDTLTVEQIRGIYSGQITNWKEVGGNDARIIAYQRNADSGSQNYMISFMGDTPLMKPVTDVIPASMSGILDVVANYDNGIDAIGYSVYAYSDGMYENISEIKYIKVNGVEPSLDTLADGSYPLLGYNYAVFSAEEPENSSVRALVKWIQSDVGQQVIAEAGYIPYRQVDGLTLPEPAAKTLYMAEASSGIPQPETMADYCYQCNRVPESFTTSGLDEKVQNFITQAEAELKQIDEEKMRAYLSGRVPYGYSLRFNTEKTLVNGYLSIKVGWVYDLGFQDSPYYYYDVRTAVFDICTGEQLELSDLFFDGVDFVPLLNRCLAEEAVSPFSGFGTTHDMLRDFTGLYEGEFAFTADSILFRPGGCFADGAELSIASLREYMVTGIPRDMAGYADPETPIYKKIRLYDTGDLTEVKNGITIWYLDSENTILSEEVCGRVNAFIDSLYETYFTEEKLMAAAKEKGIEADGVYVGPWPDFTTSLHGHRYIRFAGANTAFPRGNDVSPGEFTVVEGHRNPYYFRYFFHAGTGEELRIGDLFAAGWENSVTTYVFDENYEDWDESTWKDYTDTPDWNTCRVLEISEYDSAPYRNGDLSDLEIPVTVYVEAENGDRIAVSVQREYIK